MTSCCIQSIQSSYWRGQGSRVSGGLDGLASDVGPAAGSCPTPSPPPPRAEVVAVHQDSHGGKKWSRQISRHPPGVGFSSVYPSSTATRAKTMWLEKMFLATPDPFSPDPFSPDLVGPPEEPASKPVRVAGDEPGPSAWLEPLLGGPDAGAPRIRVGERGGRDQALPWPLRPPLSPFRYLALAPVWLLAAPENNPFLSSLITLSSFLAANP